MKRHSRGPVAAKSTSSEALRAFWERCARYQRLGFDRIAAARFVSRAAGTLRGPVLDVGTGKGLFAMELARMGLPVVSVDIDGEQQQFARKVVEDAGVSQLVQFVTADASNLNYPDGHFCCVAMMDVLHHLEHPRPVLREMTRVLSAGHPIIVAEFDEAGFDVVDRVYHEDGTEHARTSTTLEMATQELLRIGFRPQRRSAGHLHSVVVMVEPSPVQRIPFGGSRS